MSFEPSFEEQELLADSVELSGIALVVAEDIHTAPVAALALVPLLGLLAVFAHERHHRLQSMLELSSAYRGTALVLGDVIEADDGYTGEHCKSVVSLALEVAEHLGLSKMLKRVRGFMRQVGQIVRSHHERWDGAGYPDGLAGERIPLEARIITCCDTWNAMRTDRPYRKALSHDVAVAELLSNAGRQFDPHVVEAFVRVVAPADQPDAPQASAAAAVRAPAPLIAGPIEV